MYLRQGSLDMQLGVKEVAHTWTSHSPDWFDLDGNLLRYAQDKPDFSQAPDGADDFSTSMGRLVARRFLPVAILIGMLYVGLAVVSGAVVKNPLFIAALFPLAVGFADVCWYLYRHPIRLRLTPSARLPVACLSTKSTRYLPRLGFTVIHALSRGTSKSPTSAAAISTRWGFSIVPVVFY